MLNESLELRLERIKSRSNLALQNLQRFHDVSSIRQRYAEGILQVNMCVRVTPSAAPQYFARTIIQASANAALHDAGSLDESANGGQLPVFVWVGDVSQGFCPCASLIRLERLNGIDVMLMESRQRRIGSRFKAPLWVFAIDLDVFDEKLSSFLFRPGVLPRQFVEEVVECGTKVVDDFPNNDSGFQGKVIQHLASEPSINFLTRHERDQPIYRFLIGDEFVLLGFSVPLNDHLEFVNMSISSVDPGESPSQ